MFDKDEEVAGAVKVKEFGETQFMYVSKKLLCNHVSTGQPCSVKLCSRMHWSCFCIETVSTDNIPNLDFKLIEIKENRKELHINISDIFRFFCLIN